MPASMLKGRLPGASSAGPGKLDDAGVGFGIMLQRNRARRCVKPLVSSLRGTEPKRKDSLGGSEGGHLNTIGLAVNRESKNMKLPDQAPHDRGKILNHGDGIGEVDQAAIEQRARELAEIDGFTAGQVNEGHRHQARLEMLGADDPDASNDDEGAIAEMSDEDDVPGESGGAVSPGTNAAANADEQSDAEQLYAEGIAEAEHDRMTASREQEDREDAV